ncbi:MAG: hypothetical protein JSU08_07815 [Acidobacteria bacterium]|nr:hypothetical protein [Acidobacteriota bacterium]
MNGDTAAHRASWREHIQLLAAIEAVAVFCWLLPASVHIVEWPASGAVRLALLAPTWQLAAWLGAGVVAYATVRISGRVSPAARVLAALPALWLVALPYVPWIPDRLPLLLVLAGELRWVIAAAVGARTLVAVTGAGWIVDLAGRIGRRTVFAASLVVYLAIGLWSVSTNGLGGDEPHYLVITESLLKDRDLDIENNHQRGDYRSFFRGDLRPDYMQRGVNGVLYSIHAPGLPAVLLPAYTAGGHLGAVAFIALLAACAAVAVFEVAALVAGQREAVLTWLAVCLTVPWVPHAWAIFPEMPGALLVAWAVLWLVQPFDAAGPTRWFVRGLALAVLPWLHTKFIVLLAIFSVGLGLRLLRALPRLLALAAPIGTSCALWLYSFYVMYGRVDPEAPYGAYSRAYVLNSNIVHGLLGLFFDQKFGLLVYAPVYLLALWGGWVGLRTARLRYAALVLLAAAGAFIVSTARLYMFWGGSSAPARFFVPVLPCLAPFVTLGFARAQAAAPRALAGMWLAISVGVAAIGTASPARLLLFSEPHGRAKILELFQAGSPLSLVVPTFTDPDWPANVAPLMSWAAAAAVAALVLVACARLRRGPWTVATVASLAFLLAGAVATARPQAAVRDATATRGDLDVLWRFDGSRFRTLDYERLARATPDRFVELTTVRLHPDPSSTSGGPVDSGPLDLPPGVFDAFVWFTGTATRTGTIEVAGPRATFGRASGALENPTAFLLTLPAAARRTVVRIPDPQVARAVSEIRLVPREIDPPRLRDPRPVRAIESLPGRPAAYLVYTDGNAYPEMGTFWSRGTAATTVLVAPNGAQHMTLTLSTGPNDGVVTLETPEGRRQIAMKAQEEQQVHVELPPGRVVPITIGSNVMFRPGEVNPASKDFRGLGCQVRIALE